MKNCEDNLTHPTEVFVTDCEIEGVMKLCQVKYYKPNWLNVKYPKAKGVLGQYFFDDIDDGHYVIIGIETMRCIKTGEIEKNKIRGYLMCTITGAVCLRTVKVEQDFDRILKVSIEAEDLLRVRDRIFKEKIGNG